MPEVYADAQLTIELLPALGRLANNAYVLRPHDGGPVTVVDVPEGFEAVLEALADLPVERVIITHSHFDHWGGYDVMRARVSAPVLVGAEETNIDASRPVERLADRAELAVGAARLRVIHTPGHTPGSICLHVGGAVITGDTLFPGGPGHSRTHGALEQEIASITSKLYALPEATVVLPGHGPGTTIGESKREYAVFSSREHPADLHGDVLWLES
ncbi:MAG: MBL fold metallo-hydrolase [Chloroflexi bacterium]|nr:MBL fold metallo-hydrolase [Chloroflexota bacterium]